MVALMAPLSGFHHAREEPRTSITVESVEWVKPAVRYWNRRAGWQLFTYSNDPEVKVFKRNGNCTVCAWIITPKNGWTEPYVKCGITVQKSAQRFPAIVAHELGHCLGFRHQPKGVMHRTAEKNKRFDRRLLKQAGYALSTGTESSGNAYRTHRY